MPLISEEYPIFNEKDKLPPQPEQVAPTATVTKVKKTEKTMQTALSDNTGLYATCEFVVGTDTVVRREGVLRDVGTDYIVLHHTNDDSYEVCDLYSLRFITFHSRERSKTRGR